jgi:alpha-ketoglutarate-dependent taurine dioxygenase
MNLDKLSNEWRNAKQREEAARNDRVAIEQKIIELHPAKEEGALTIHTALGSSITLTGKVTYKVDIDKLTALTSSWPLDIRPIKTKVEADESKLKAIRADVPELWAKIADAIETKPAKTGVAIKFAE